MGDTPRHDSPSRRRAVGALFLLLLVAVGLSIIRRVGALEDRVGVVLEGTGGALRVAGADRGAAPVQWIAEPAGPGLVFLPAEVSPGEGWERVAADLLPGRRIVLVDRPTETRQSSGSGRDRREVLAQRALLLLEDGDGRREPALGIGTAIVREGDSGAVAARTIVQLVGPEGRALRADAEPLFNDRPVGLLDRLRGVPPHVVRFGLAEIPEDPLPAPPDRSAAPAGSAEGSGGPGALNPVPLEGEEAIEAIEKLRENRPKRGEIPKPAPAPPAEPEPAPNSPGKPN